MSELIVVRHGQASFLADDYDQLSELGREQSQLLGRYWVEHGWCPSRIVVGPRKRHQETAKAVLAELRAADMELPPTIHDPRLDEFDWDGLKAYADSTLSHTDEGLAARKADFAAATDPPSKRRTIQRYIEGIMERWVTGSFHEEGLETWREFCSRVALSMQAHTANSPSGSRVVFFTSGGVAAVISGRVLGLSPQNTLSLIWTLRNGALVEYVYDNDRVSLNAFNSIPHLPARELWSHR